MGIKRKDICFYKLKEKLCGFTTHIKGCNKNNLSFAKFYCTKQVSFILYVTKQLKLWEYSETYFVKEIVSY